jgi:DNA-directed RNA polymerase I subunit RPA1
MVDAVRSLLESGKVANQDSESDLDTGGDDSGLVHAQNTYTIKAIKAHLKAGGSRAATNNQAVGEARTELVRQFFADIGKAAKCAGCGGFSPKYRKDKYLKIFMKSLPRKHQIANTQSERRMRNPLVILNSKRKQRTQTKPNSNGTVFDEGVADLDMSEANSSEGEGEALDIEMDDLEEHIEDDMQSAHTLSQPKRQKGQPEETQNFFMTSEEVHAALVLLFEEESEILRLVYSPRSKGRALGNLSADMFFISTLLVPPIKYRPEHPSQTEEISEASKNRPYKAILLACQKIAEIHREIKTGQINDLIPTQRTPRNYNHLKLAQVELQDAVNALIDKSSSTGSNNASQEDGVKQLLEKKQGLFRMNMMGKRVNFAGRSVISPDPNIETNEIGVPPIFAKKLTYPEPVTNHNYYELKEAILNGPDNWPGAVAVENEDGQVISLRGKSADDRLAIANQLLAPSKNTMNGRYGKKVHRHLNNGDIVIMNRQPTLHKPSMMCHRTRVLPGEKTIRMHYANCNTYNADFDGDEMNMHFPQNELARAEANTIADTDHQYLSGTAGKPLRGLIQDHITMGVHLTNRDTFFDREEYQQLVYSAMRPEDNHTVTGTLITVTPAILKPKPLWTGKQVISTVLKNITSKHHMGLTLTSKSQTAGDRWGAFTEEEIVKIQDGELLTGIIDKKQIGPASGGLVHAVYETFGHTTAGRLLSVLGRLLTKLLHIRAFSCGVEDLILTPEGEKVRLENLEAAKTLGLKVATKYVTLEQRNPTSTDPELLRRLEMVQRDEEQMKGLDEITKKHNMLLSSEITKACLPDGLVKVFPKNQMQAMTGTGAKGTPVNANLISCNLGQQVLEGRRVPTMVSGKTLPCFKPYESSIRAGGYIVDRFLTGVKPQEYYFHAMAGREGLIDTAVKTSRSGYLQRCIVKGMEGLKVEYDISVRDADGSVVQFLYGEDGLDVCKQTYLRQFKFMAENFFSLYNNMQVQELYPRIQCTEASAHNKKASKGFVKRGLDEPRDPVLSIYSPSRYAGSMSENYYLALRQVWFSSMLRQHDLLTLSTVYR